MYKCPTLFFILPNHKISHLLFRHNKREPVLSLPKPCARNKTRLDLGRSPLLTLSSRNIYSSFWVQMSANKSHTRVSRWFLLGDNATDTGNSVSYVIWRRASELNISMAWQSFLPLQRGGIASPRLRFMKAKTRLRLTWRGMVLLATGEHEG